jgi:hypothetical protein
MALLGSSPDFPGVFAPNHEEITESAAWDQMWIIPNIDIVAIGKEAPAGWQPQEGNCLRAAIRQVLHASGLEEIRRVGPLLAAPNVPATDLPLRKRAQTMEWSLLEGLDCKAHTRSGVWWVEVRAILAANVTLL